MTSIRRRVYAYTLGAAIMLLSLGQAVRAVDPNDGVADDDATLVRSLSTELKVKRSRTFFELLNQVDQRLHAKDPGAEAFAKTLLEARKSFVTHAEYTSLLEKMAKNKKPVLAAKWLTLFAKAWHVANDISDQALVVVGQLIVEDGQREPELVLAQMEIIEDGYFAGELGDLKAPVCFRAQGYQDLDAKLTEAKEGVVLLKPLKLRAVAKKDQASLKGKVVLDGPPLAEGKSVTLQMQPEFGKPNTPHHGYSPRPRWPEPLSATVSKSGEFTTRGLNPGCYDIFVKAEGFRELHTTLTFQPGKELDAGALKLMTNDLGFYADQAKPPKAEPLKWEKDYAAALERAKQEKRPLLVMMTATWCGPCKLLESETLQDPWIRYFLASFVMVKAYEDKEVEKNYGLEGYPTLIFADSTGKNAYKTVGYQPSIEFAAECAKGLKALDMKLPPELQKLIDKKVVKLD